MTNPLTRTWTTPFGLPPFAEIADDHFAPAFEQGFAEARAAYEAIATNPAAPDFDNTIAAMERADALLDRVGAVFFNLSSTDGNEARRALQRDLSPKFAAFHSDIMLDPRLFARVEDLWQRRDSLGLDEEQARVLLLTRRGFVRAGAQLGAEDQARLRAVMQRLASLGTQFAQNVQKDEEDWVMELAEAELEGLPGFLRSAARAAAAERGRAGHVITLSRSLIVPFLQFSPRRDLRERAFRAWAARGEMRPETATLPIVAEMLALREERARLLGYPDFAHFKLETEMAKAPAAVRDLLTAVWEPARAQALRDAARLSEMLSADGINDALAPWDWRYYATIRQREEHAIDEAEVKPYFQLDNMIAAAFDCATRLFGLSFVPLDVPLHHPDARAWEVRKGARHMGVFIGDYFARGPKRSGAWCSRFRDQSKLDGEVRPVVINVCNFAKPPAGEPALLTFDDARTLFHEFGHALHGLLSDVTHGSVSGTSVARDFVELPSQLYEHWLATPEVLSAHARHAETGAPIPEDLRDRLIAAENFDQGFATVEYVASALVDLEFHTGRAPADPAARQAEILAGLGMPGAITMRHATPHFQHVFAGDGYSSGYYSYMWSEVMDADAFAAFEEAGDIFDAATATALETHIYSAGGSRDAEALYTAFRGRLPGVEALLRQRGLAA
ncbi:M3 family metallopeptidase [Halovulum dunhuangense]|uniref:M3 family metallopeptidase n=1 Tax=Halovulum dunhuangense TaxID=1505036 RepID=A0A849KXP9_9RHOB|nr:M3 family metallopeptidase [Halovulum dunhuangense]NNU79407.1 M3 family metallopeptidase [Halovulum dunhuangense]